MQGVQAKKVLGYMILPGVLPRARRLFASGFGYIAFLMASIYGSVRLLPPTHPYLNPANTGRFGIRHVIGEAANNLVLSRKNIDQILIFAALLMGMVILGAQILLLGYGVIIQFISPAMAQSIMNMFETPNPTNDVALVLLDRVFGVPDFFCSGSVCSNINDSLPFPFHTALHEMLRFYSMGLLVVGTLIFLYFIVVVIGETAVTGTPFGQRFQNVWVPIRLVVALGLLTPISHGLNSGQYITLYAAKMGSGFATNGWIGYNLAMREGQVFNPAGENKTLVAMPAPPDISPLVQAMSTIHSCATLYWIQNSSIFEGADMVGGSYAGAPYKKIKPYFVKNAAPWMKDQDSVKEMTENTKHADALKFYNDEDIIIRFGVLGVKDSSKESSQYEKFKGRVEPTCGEIKVHTSDIMHKGQGSEYGGSAMMQEEYFNLVKNMWFEESIPLIGNGFNKQLIELSQRNAAYFSPKNWKDIAGKSLSCKIGCQNKYLPTCDTKKSALNCLTAPARIEAKARLIEGYQSIVNENILKAWNRYRLKAFKQEIDQDILERGWGGAGIWYNKINEANGSFITAARRIPTMTNYPVLMEWLAEQKAAHDSQLGPVGTYVSDDDVVNMENLQGSEDDALMIVRGMSDVMEWWNTDGINPLYPEKATTGSVFKDIINVLFGTQGLLAIRGHNASIHPLAQLTAVGKGLVDSAVQNVAASTVTSFLAGPLSSVFSQQFGAATAQFGKFLVTTAFIGLTAGFVLFYVLPFLPFLYFFFAVGGWVKGIFEAMVGVPLWALAHLRIDGEGLPGQAAANGYYLIFDVFVRPILIVFGLIASLFIFTAQVRILNFIWTMVVDNLTGYAGHDTVIKTIYKVTIHRDIVDQFFFTVVYTIIVYMLATSSFKLIDSIPESILRFMGASVSSFSDNKDDATEGLTRTAAVGGLTLGQQATEGLQQFASDTGNVAGDEFRKLSQLLSKKNQGL